MPQTIGPSRDALGAFFVRYVRNQGLGGSSCIPDLADYVVGFIAQDVDHQHPGTLPRKLQTSMVPDSRAASSHHRDLILEPHPSTSLSFSGFYITATSTVMRIALYDSRSRLSSGFLVRVTATHEKLVCSQPNRTCRFDRP